jgi:hypothetical protein
MILFLAVVKPTCWRTEAMILFLAVVKPTCDIRQQAKSRR